MYQYLIKELINRGFFESNGILSKFSGSNQYIIQEALGTVTVERSFDGDDDTKNRVLDHIQTLAGRYALTAAHIRGGKLRVSLTKPGQNVQEEAIRIDFLIQSLETGIENILKEYPPSAPITKQSPLTGPAKPNFSQDLPDQALRTREIIQAEMPQADIFANEAQIPPTAQKPLVPPPIAFEEHPEDEIIDEDEYYKYKTVPGQPLADTSRFHFSKEVTNATKPRLRNNYVPQDNSPDSARDPHPVYARVVDRRFSVTGFLGAGLGAILGAILMGIARTLGYPAQPVAILIPFLVIWIYRLIAGYQMPIWLGVTFILGSILMGSVLVTTTDILTQSSIGFLSAFKGGILAHLDNANYYVANVWLKIAVSVLAASIPTMLLLAGGKRKTKVY